MAVFAAEVPLATRNERLKSLFRASEIGKTEAALRENDARALERADATAASIFPMYLPISSLMTLHMLFGMLGIVTEGGAKERARLPLIEAPMVALIPSPTVGDR